MPSKWNRTEFSIFASTCIWDTSMLFWVLVLLSFQLMSIIPCMDELQFAHLYTKRHLDCLKFLEITNTVTISIHVFELRFIRQIQLPESRISAKQIHRMMIHRMNHSSTWSLPSLDTGSSRSPRETYLTSCAKLLKIHTRESLDIFCFPRNKFSTH